MNYDIILGREGLERNINSRVLFQASSRKKNLKTQKIKIWFD
jgi:hypothetical protein